MTVGWHHDRDGARLFSSSRKVFHVCDGILLVDVFFAQLVPLNAEWFDGCIEQNSQQNTTILIIESDH